MLLTLGEVSMLLGETFMTWGERPAQLRVLPSDAKGEILPLMEQGEFRGRCTEGAAMITHPKISVYEIIIR